MPPHLAGREGEQRLLKDVIADLANGIPPRAELLLYGPRGNGKTVLLQWLEEEAARFRPLDVVGLPAAAIPDRGETAERLLPAAWWERLSPAEISMVGLVWRPGREKPPPVDRILAARARKRPLALLIDEAHTLSLELGRVLLNASQAVGRRHPFLLVLAGTPNLESHLNRMGASFWSRAERLRIGRLDNVATAEGLERPFLDSGVEVTSDGRDAMVRLAQGYPFFIQLVGDAVWAARHDRSGAPRSVTLNDVRRARPAFESARGLFYADRYEELEVRGLLPVARAVADGFEERATLGFGALNERIAEGLGGGAPHDRVVAARNELRDLGYVWRAGPTPVWEPGIPSLLDYVRDLAPV